MIPKTPENKGKIEGCCSATRFATDFATDNATIKKNKKFLHQEMPQKRETLSKKNHYQYFYILHTKPFFFKKYRK